jgi:predicted permease
MRALLRRLRARLKYRRHAEDLARELDVHRAMAEDDLRHGGVPPSEARWKAARLLGNDTLAREDARQVWVARWIDQIRQDVRYAVRGFRATPGHTAATMVLLFLCLTLLSSLITVFNARFLQPWPLPDAERVVIPTSRPASRPEGVSGTLGFQAMAVRSILTEPKEAAYVVYERAELSLKGGAAVSAAFVSPAFVEVLGLPLSFGQSLLEAAGGEPPIVISHALAAMAFGSAASAPGHLLTVGGINSRVVGVLGRDFRGLHPWPLEVLIPTTFATAWRARDIGDLLDTRDPHDCCVELVGRLRAGASLQSATAELTGLVQRYADAHGLPRPHVGMTRTAAIDRAKLPSSLTRLYAYLAAGSLLVWLLVCANLANMQLARGLRRRREFLMRSALGASCGRLVRQSLTESSVLLCGVAATTIASAWIVPDLLARALGSESQLPSVPDRLVIGAIAVVAGLTLFAFALVPAMRTSRPAPHADRDGRVRGWLLGGQIAASAALIMAATLLNRSVAGALNGQLDFAAASTVAIEITPPTDDPAVSNHLQLRAAWAALRSELDGAGIRYAVALAQPLSNRRDNRVVRTEDGHTTAAVAFSMTPNGLSLLDVPLVSGRVYSADLAAGEAVVNEELAQRLWPGQSPLGRRLTFQGRPASNSVTIVGVARNAHLVDFGAIVPAVHLPLPASVPIRLQLLTTADPAGVADLVRVVSTQAPTFTVTASPLRDRIREALSSSVAGARIAGALASIAIVVSVSGVFSVAAVLVEHRRREMAIRVALGADRSDIGSTVAALAARPVLLGLAMGLLMAALTASGLRGYLLGISPADPWTLLCVGLALASTIAAGLWIPLRRALRVDPAVTLRSE